MVEYYEHTCTCGCEGLIQIKPWHKWKGTPVYMRGHNRIGEKQSKEAKRKIADGNKSKIVPKETRKKMSLAKLGRKQTEEQKQKQSEAMMGHIVSKETGKKISAAKIGHIVSEYTRMKIRKALAGSNSPNWLGGISFEPYSSKFNNKLKQKIRERDNNTCQLCWRTQEEEGRNLSVHHIDYDKKHCDETNLITLCRSCNNKVNANRKSWTKFFQAKIKEVC